MSSWTRRANELYVADGYGDQRVVVFDADTGKFKRMWGALRQSAAGGDRAQSGRAQPEAGGRRAAVSSTWCTR